MELIPTHWQCCRETKVRSSEENDDAPKSLSLQYGKAAEVPECCWLNSDFRTATGVRVSSQTVRNRLHTANMRAYRPAVRPILTLRHRTALLQWTRDHVNWQLRHWTPVLFTDE